MFLSIPADVAFNSFTAGTPFTLTATVTGGSDAGNAATTPAATPVMAGNDVNAPPSIIIARAGLSTFR